MAIFRPGGVAGAVSGKLGGQVYVVGRSGPVVRSRASGTGRDTAASVLARGMPGRIGAGWSALTDAQRGTWRTAAAALRFPNRLGVLRSISGFQLYTKYVMDVYLGSPPAALVAPSQSLLYSPTLAGAYFIESGPYALTTGGLPLPGTTPVEYAYLQARRRSTQLTGFNRVRRVTSYTRQLGSKDIYAAVAAEGFEVFAGTPFAAAARWQVGGGYVGVPVFATGVSSAVPFNVDSFEANTLAPYTNDTSNFSIVSETIHSGVLVLQGSVNNVASVTKSIRSTSGLLLYPLRGHVFECWMRLADANCERCYFQFCWQSTSNFYYFILRNNGIAGIQKIVGGVGSNVAVGAVTGFAVGTWYRCVVELGYAGACNALVYDSGGANKMTVNATDTSLSYGGIGFAVINVAGATGTAKYDAFAVTGRKA